MKDRLVYMKQLIFFLLLFLSSLPGITQSEDALRKKHFNIENEIALQGYDPVSYFLAGPVKGSSSFACVYKGITYHFSSDKNLQLFKASPAKYEPAYGGWCAYAMGNSGEKVEIDPRTYKITNGKLYLFYNFYFTNTLTKWNADENNLRTKADQYWIKLYK